MKELQQTNQGERTIIYCETADIDNAGEFVKEAMDKIRAVLGGSVIVPVLAFCNLKPDTMVTTDESFIKAGAVVNEIPADLPQYLKAEKLPSCRVVNLVTDEQTMPRSALHAELNIYAKVFGLKIAPDIYEYHFPSSGNLTVYSASVVG